MGFEPMNANYFFLNVLPYDNSHTRLHIFLLLGQLVLLLLERKLYDYNEIIHRLFLEDLYDESLMLPHIYHIHIYYILF